MDAIGSSRWGCRGIKKKEQVGQIVDGVYRSESRRVLATLIHLLGDFDWAEEAMHDAFAAAVEQWPQKGVPANPRAWLVSTGRFKAIDAMRGARGSTHRSRSFLSSRVGQAFEPKNGTSKASKTTGCG